MKSRLSSTIWLLVITTGIALFAVLGLAFEAGAHSGGVPLSQALPPGNAGLALMAAFGIAIVVALALLIMLPKRVLRPVGALASFSERFAAGDQHAKADDSSQDEFGFIAGNLNRSLSKVSKAFGNQAAQESLQRSITDLLNLINQVGRGNLTLRGKVTDDALGNVAESMNSMLDNFTTVLERVRRAAMDVSTNSTRILAGDGRDELRHDATGSGNHEYIIGRRRADGIHETSFQ